MASWDPRSRAPVGRTKRWTKPFVPCLHLAITALGCGCGASAPPGESPADALPNAVVLSPLIECRFDSAMTGPVRVSEGVVWLLIACVMVWGFTSPFLVGKQ